MDAWRSSLAMESQQQTWPGTGPCWRRISRTDSEATLALDDETPLGQIVGIMALGLAEADEVVVHVSNALSLSHASGRQLDDLGSLLSITRKAATKSTVTATLYGVSGTTIPAASRAQTEAGDDFSLDADALIGAGGSVDAAMTAVKSGAITVAQGTLTRIATAVSGWTSVNNGVAATVGRARETDSEFRARYRLSTARLANGTISALESAIAEAGAVRFRIRSNDTANPVIVQNVSIPSHSVMPIIDINVGTFNSTTLRTELTRVKNLGIAYAGGATLDAATGIRYQPAQLSRVRVQVTIRTDDAFSADGILQIRQNLVNYAAGTWTGGAGLFDTSGFQIGEPIDEHRLRVPINAVSHHAIQSLSVTSSDGNALGAPDLDTLYTLSLGDALVTVVD